MEGADLVGVERDGLAGLVAVVGAVGRHATGRREGEDDEERRDRGRRGRHRSRRAALTRPRRVWGWERETGTGAERSEACGIASGALLAA